MEQVLVVFSSVSSANGIKKHLLKKYNIQAKIRQTPANISVNGCSYGLLVNVSEVETVKKVAKENNLTIRGVFRQDGTRI